MMAIGLQTNDRHGLMRAFESHPERCAVWRGIVCLEGVRAIEAEDSFAVIVHMRFRRAGVRYTHRERVEMRTAAASLPDFAAQLGRALDRGFGAVTLGQARRIP